MTRYTISLDLNHDAPASDIKKLFGKLEGVVNISISKTKSGKKNKKKEMEEWINNVKWLSDNFDSSSLDMNDDRTQYLMGK